MGPIAGWNCRPKAKDSRRGIQGKKYPFDGGKKGLKKMLVPGEYSPTKRLVPGPKTGRKISRSTSKHVWARVKKKSDRGGGSSFHAGEPR